MAKSMAMAMAMASSVVTNSMTKFIVHGCLSSRVYVARVCFRFLKKQQQAAEGDEAVDEDEAEVAAICKELSNKAAPKRATKMPASVSE